ncbi:MAG TPA: extracellular solute-binding protein [Anaerolineales bacterium]|nr:extracellular solute-binding protein [Anaerolineales bacterium]
MKTKTFALLLNLTLLAALILSACGAAPTEAPVKPEAPAATEPPAATEAPLVVEAPTGVIAFPAQIADGREVEITVVGIPTEANPTGLADWKAAAARFEAKYPNVKVIGNDYVYAPDTFPALVAGNQVPTLFQAYLTDVDQMSSQGIAADLTSLYKDTKLDGVFNPRLLSLVSKDGKIYGVPMAAYVMGLAYNIKMLKDAGYDAPPKTWDELGPMAQKLTNRDAGVAGFSFIRGEPHQAGWHATTMAYNFGLKDTEIVTKGTDGKYMAGFDNPQTVATLNFIKDLQWKYDALPRELLDWPTNGDALATGRAAMVLMAGSQLKWIKETYADVDMNQFGFAPLPAGPNGEMVSLGGGDVAYISAKATPDQMEAAFYYRLFVQFDEGELKAKYEATKTNPTAVIGDPSYPMYVGEFQAKIDALTKEYANLPVENYAAFNDAVVAGKVGLQNEPQISGQDYYAALGDVVSKIVSDKNTDPAAALKAASETFQTNVLDMLK